MDFIFTDHQTLGLDIHIPKGIQLPADLPDRIQTFCFQNLKNTVQALCHLIQYVPDEDIIVDISARYVRFLIGMTWLM